MTNTDLWGCDIALDYGGQAKVAANGELILTEGVATGLQDIALRLFTPLGGLFYDHNFGSLVHNWVLENSTQITRAALASEVWRRIEHDPRVAVGTVHCRVLEWTEQVVIIEASWRFIGEDQVLNLVLQYNKQLKELVVSDVKY